MKCLFLLSQGSAIKLNEEPFLSVHYIKVLTLFLYSVSGSSELLRVIVTELSGE